MPTSLPHKLVHFSHPESHIPGYEMPDAAAPPPTRRVLIGGFVLAVLAAWVGFGLEHTYHNVDDATVALPWMTPFVLLLACIAAMPFIARHWWESHYHHVACTLGAIVAGYYLTAVENGPGNIGRSVAEYISFIFLLGSLFVVSGGILIHVRARATPLANMVLLLIGAIIANAFGTTGASMLLIRPFLRMNTGRLRPYHVVFFIFIVSNTGGSLTPIGDPPLFLGYLMGVPFFWVFEHCWPIWLLVNGLLLVTFFVIDSRFHRATGVPPVPIGQITGETPVPRNNDAQMPDTDHAGPIVSLYGATNLLFVALIIVGILMNTTLNNWTRRHLGIEGPWRELLMAIAAFGSLAITPHRIHGGNHFNYTPIKEVAYLFVGIFLTMVPALNYLYHHSETLHLTQPGQYYFACGGLSAVLDNAPTYLTFLKTELGSIDAPPAERITHLISDPQRNAYLVGISMGAVLFGAMTYIGNGPNFMVKSIAEHAGAEVPGFFCYIYAFSLPILLPMLVLVWVFFLR